MKTVAARQLIITSTADDLSGGTNINNLKRLRNPKMGCFSERFAILVNFRPQLLKIDQDNLRVKLN